MPAQATEEIDSYRFFGRRSARNLCACRPAAEETYRVAKDASVDTEHGIVKGSEYTAKKGERVTVHYTEEAGNMVVHFIKHM